MNEPTATLPQFRDDGQTLKSEALVDLPFCILESIDVQRRDGSIGYKWIVRHLDGTLGIYWAPGMAPPQQVRQWFRQYPGKELYVTLRRKDAGAGVTHWVLEQRLPDVQPAPLSRNGPEGDIVEELPF